MTVRASALARFVDCEQLRDRMIAKIDAEMAEPVADPCWLWAPIYIQQHQSDLLPWALNWLEDAIQRSKLGGMSYEQATHAIYEKIAQCNAPQSQAKAEGMRIVVHARTKHGMGASAASAPGGASRHEARLTVSYNSGGIGLGGIGPSPTRCQPVPEVVFMKTIAVGNNPHAQATGAILHAGPGSGLNGEPIYIKTEISISGDLDAHPEWLEKPNDVEVQIGGWRADITGTVTFAARFELDDGQRVLVTRIADTSMSQDGAFTFQNATAHLWVPEWLDAGSHTLEAVILLDWGGTVAVEYAQDTILHGSYTRSLAVDPWTHQGDIRIALGTFDVIDLALTDLRAVGHAGGDGSLASPYKFYRNEAITAADMRLFNGNPIEATFQPGYYSLGLEDVTLQPQQEMAVANIVLTEHGFRYEGIYKIERQYLLYAPVSSSSCPTNCITKLCGPRRIYIDTYKELADVNKIVIAVKDGQFTSGTGTESDPYILISFSQGIVELEVRNENTVHSARMDDGTIVAAGETKRIAPYTFEVNRATPMIMPVERITSCIDGAPCFFNADGPTIRTVYMRRPMPTKEEFFQCTDVIALKRGYYEIYHLYDYEDGECFSTYRSVCKLEVGLGCPIDWKVEFIDHHFTVNDVVADEQLLGSDERGSGAVLRGYRETTFVQRCSEPTEEYGPREVTGTGTVRLTYLPTGEWVDYPVTADDFLTVTTW